MYCSASLFLNKQTLCSFGMNTSVYKHVCQIVWNFGYRFLISKILIHPLPERIQKLWIVFSHVVRRDTSLVCLLGTPKCYNFCRVDTSSRVPPIDAPLSWWVDGIVGQTHMPSYPPLHVGHGDGGRYGVSKVANWFFIFQFRESISELECYIGSYWDRELFANPDHRGSIRFSLMKQGL
jgi:hypothetical protein